MIKKFKLYILLVAVAFSTVSCLDKMLMTQFLLMSLSGR